jgi:hypothetical protein
MLGKQGMAGFAQREEVKKINTHLSCLISNSYTDGERDNLIIFLEYHKGSSPPRLL